MATKVCTCGELIAARSPNCLKCGKSRDDAVVLNAGGGGAELKSVDTAGGQQKWGTFETHAQRTQGISSEESMQRIDDFVRLRRAPASPRAGPDSRGATPD